MSNRPWPPGSSVKGSLSVIRVRMDVLGGSSFTDTNTFQPAQNLARFSSYNFQFSKKHHHPSLSNNMVFHSSDRLRLVVERGNELMAADMNGLSDPYVKVSMDGLVKKTQRIDKTLNPVWEEEMCFSNLEGCEGCVVNFEVYDWDRFTKDVSYLIFTLYNGM